MLTGTSNESPRGRPVAGGEEISPATRRTKSFDDQAWKVHDETVNLSANISAISTTALAIRAPPELDYDLESLTGSREPRSRSSALAEVLVVAGGAENSTGSDAHCSSLSRGEVRKSRSKMKSYLKRCKDVLISGVVGGHGPGGADGQQHQQQQDVVVYHAHGDDSQPNSTSCWYLDDHLMELRPEDNREPYSSLASARLKLESEEARMARECKANADSCADGENIPTVTVTTAVTNTASCSTAKIGGDQLECNTEEAFSGAAILELGTKGIHHRHLPPPPPPPPPISRCAVVPFCASLTAPFRSDRIDRNRKS
uniref:Uncharacterized protein n=1 Tax=Anopheles farauti TaxID=69004 RepID=A0A182QD34_9DIPT